jgi:hypothetical protein
LTPPIGALPCAAKNRSVCFFSRCSSKEKRKMTPSLQIAAVYVALNALVSLVLAGNVARQRARAKVALGDGGDEKLLQAIRAHANNVEYVPLSLVMLVLLALMQASAVVLHIVGASLLIGRSLHGYGLNKNPGASVPRGVGMLLTFVAVLTSVVVLIINAVG